MTEILQFEVNTPQCSSKSNATFAAWKSRWLDSSFQTMPLEAGSIWYPVSRLEQSQTAELTSLVTTGPSVR